MSQTWADISDLAFEAALAAYIVALVCYAIELASRRAVNPAEAVATGRGAAAGTSTLVRTGGTDPVDRASIGRVESARPAPWGVRFGRAAVVVTVVGAAANVLSIVARGLAVGRLPLGNMYEFVSVICAAATITWLIVLARTGARTLGTFVHDPGGHPGRGRRNQAVRARRAGGAGAELVLEVDPRHDRGHLLQRAAGQRRRVGGLPAARPVGAIGTAGREGSGRRWPTDGRRRRRSARGRCCRCCRRW